MFDFFVFSFSVSFSFSLVGFLKCASIWLAAMQC